MDAARVARRLGADDSVIVYRRSRDRMPAHEEEARDAEAEGITINWLRTITAFRGRELQVEVQELDDAGVPHGTGRFETLTADTVVLALGQRADTAFLEGVPGVEIERGVVRVDRETFATGAPGVFAGGDAVPGERTVTVGVGHGRRAAQAVDAYLRGAHLAPVAAEAPVTLDQLRPWYLGDHARRSQPTLDPATRTAGFAEVVAGLTPDAARFEAQRCLSCGTCFECDGCFGACPEDAIVKLGVGARYRIDLDRCTGCGACVRQCPVHAIDLVPEG
jgi:NADPH-dependent glutamate synthase beta subunit-like oxidoreductase